MFKPTVYFEHGWWRVRQHYVWRNLNRDERTNLIVVYERISMMNSLNSPFRHLGYAAMLKRGIN